MKNKKKPHILCGRQFLYMRKRIPFLRIRERMLNNNDLFWCLIWYEEWHRHAKTEFRCSTDLVCSSWARTNRIDGETILLHTGSAIELGFVGLDWHNIFSHWEWWIRLHFIYDQIKCYTLTHSITWSDGRKLRRKRKWYDSIPVGFHACEHLHHLLASHQNTDWHTLNGIVLLRIEFSYRNLLRCDSYFGINVNVRCLC